MKKKLLNILKYLIFLALGIVLFYYVYKDLGLERLKNDLRNINYWWIALSFIIGLFSHYSRAIRWNMLIKPLGYKPKTSNSFFAIMIMYLTNLALPRAGEVARCTVLTKYEKVPFVKLVGTVVAERASDVIALLFFAIIILLSQIGVFREFLISHPESKEKVALIFSRRNMMIVIAVLVATILLFIIFYKIFKKSRVFKKLVELFNNFIDGIKTILQLENKWAYIGHTVFIYAMWLIAMYVVFFSYKPTAHLSIFAAMTAFVMGALAMIAPVQGGIGPYHFMVMETLVIYGIAEPEGKVFAFIAHAAANVPLMLFGAISLIILPIVNKSYKPEVET